MGFEISEKLIWLEVHDRRGVYQVYLVRPLLREWPQMFAQQCKPIARHDVVTGKLECA